jgi:hypothetical protein
MCKIGFHNCPACGEEYKCDQPNSECPVMNHYAAQCAKCDYWDEELHNDNERYAQMMREREEEYGRWVKENQS